MFEIQDWKDTISQCNYDDMVGIRIAKLTSHDTFSTFITEILPNKSVKPHYHKNGSESYHIVSGSGNIRLRDVTTNEEHLYTVQAQQSFTIPANVEHQLINAGYNSLVLMFTCPDSHLDSDRYFL